MPYGDGTGPRGRGPRTGRGLGFCAGFDRPGYTSPDNRPYGRGLGRGRGYRYCTSGRRGRYYDEDEEDW